MQVVVVFLYLQEIFQDQGSFWHLANLIPVDLRHKQLLSYSCTIIIYDSCEKDQRPEVIILKTADYITE